jgi:3-oxoacyl-[acyl-carrier protein] reductase
MPMTTSNLLNRVALVTGSSRGIGAAIAMRLAADGAKLVLHAKSDASRANAVAEKIRAAGGVATVVLGDLETSEAPIRIVRDAFAVHDRLDILVCNAGGGGGGLAVDVKLDLIDRCLAVNLRSVILLTSEFARLTKSPFGRVVVISSGAATYPAYGSSIYSAAKAGAEAFARSVAQELGERGITVNSVAPGTTRTDMIEGMSWVEKVPRWAALRRVGLPEDIADIVAFLASDDARWLTGATLPASGGLVTSAANIISYA